MKSESVKPQAGAKPNKLIGEASLYLRQHAHNPVQWHPWGEEARALAKAENKLILVSIGYSACHWCHVMERESFEDVAVAEAMNAHFICIKVDREERPDVDQVHMDAVQMMRQQGGWPLNCFTTPDGDPIYGGTYFPKDQWLNVLRQLKEIWINDSEQVKEYGVQLREGLQVSASLALEIAGWKSEKSAIAKAVAFWAERWDNVHGGPRKAPKFPLPCNYLFLLHYAVAANDASSTKHVQLTLDRMMAGGLHDQIGGGFARYSTDEFWKVPHFEKMLYDNAQLLQLYSEAYAHFGLGAYRETALGIIAWLEREMKQKAGGYASALDADSEGEEGIYYTFSSKELMEAGLLDRYSQYYHTGDEALWEGKWIALRKTHRATDQEQEGYFEGIKKLNLDLLALREKRIPPGIDTKRITSWNAMLASALLSADRYLAYSPAGDLANALMQTLDADPATYDIHHLIGNDSKKIGFCEDYAFLIAACLDHFEQSHNHESLSRAKSLMDAALDRFYDLDQGFFYQTSAQQTDLPSRPAEFSDNVIAANNSVMAHNLARLTSFGFDQFRQKYLRLLQGMQAEMAGYPEGHGHWWDLYLAIAAGQAQVVITGAEAEIWSGKLRSIYTPSVNWAVSTKPSRLAIFQERFNPNLTQVFICRNNTCSLPIQNLADAETAVKQLSPVHFAN